MTSVSEMGDATLADLSKFVTGTVATPSDAQYSDLVRPWNLAVSPTPAVVVEARDAQDVVAPVHVAGDAGMPVAVQATGPGIGADLDGALLVTTGRLENAWWTEAAGRGSAPVSGGHG